MALPAGPGGVSSGMDASALTPDMPLPDDVPAALKQRRLAEIVALQEKTSVAVFAAHVGRRERVLVTGPSKRDPAQLIGRTDGFKTVILPAGVGAIGEFVDVTIERTTMATLFARSV